MSEFNILLEDLDVNIEDTPRNAVDLAGILYTNYCDKVGGIAWNGDPLPTWEEFMKDPGKDKQCRAWVHAANCAIIMGQMLHFDPLPLEHFKCIPK